MMVLLLTLLAPPSFLNDVQPILTKAGCNSGGCHGKLAGQNGFRLSLRGYAPEQDDKSIVREFAGRRVNVSDPDSSLLLQKASGRTAHGGGVALSVSSAEYAALKAWMAGGAPASNATDARLVKLTLSSGGTLKPKETMALRATAHWNDGRTTDVTHRARWDVNDGAVLSVDGLGHVTALRSGSTSVRASFLASMAVASFTVPYDAPLETAGFPLRQFLDTHVDNQRKALHLPATPLCDDASFLRRVMLDTLGKLPTPLEVRAFLADGSPGKRPAMVAQLMQRPEFDDRWSLFLSDLLQNRKERDHDVRGTLGVQQFHGWLREQLLARRGWDAIAKDVLLARGAVTDNPAVGYSIVTVGEHREVEKSEAAESAAQVFLGTRIGCARCHNHPLESLTQDDFYRFSGYFTRIRFDRGDPKKKREPTLFVGLADAKENAKPVAVRQPRTNAMLTPRTLDRQELPLGDDPRVALVEWMVKQPSFRGAMVNRLWKHFLREGLVEPVDDLRATNPPSNPELFAALADDFANHGYDLRHTIARILNSRTYQQSSEGHGPAAAETRFYSRYYAKRLPGEVLLDAISDATGVPEKFVGYPLGWRALQVADPAAASPFLKMFGSSERTTACACERGSDVTLPQALALLNGDRIPARLANPQGALMKLLAREPDDTKMMEELFLRTFSRLPSEAERQAMKQQLADGKRDDVFRDLFWALLNSKEFVFNH